MDKITKAIDSLIERTVGKNCVTAVEAAEKLDKLGILKDSKTRKGQPLREILRAGKLPQARKQEIFCISFQFFQYLPRLSV